MKQSYEDFVKELEELWTDENIKDVLDYMGVEYDYLENNDTDWDKKEKIRNAHRTTSDNVENVKRCKN